MSKQKLNIIHNVGDMQCAVLDCERRAVVAVATGWAPTTDDAMELTPICQQHADQMQALYNSLKQ